MISLVVSCCSCSFLCINGYFFLPAELTNAPTTFVVAVVLVVVVVAGAGFNPVLLLLLLKLIFLFDCWLSILRAIVVVVIVRCNCCYAVFIYFFSVFFWFWILYFGFFINWSNIGARYIWILLSICLRLIAYLWVCLNFKWISFNFGFFLLYFVVNFYFLFLYIFCLLLFGRTHTLWKLYI